MSDGVWLDENGIVILGLEPFTFRQGLADQATREREVNGTSRLTRSQVTCGTSVPRCPSFDSTGGSKL